MKLCYLINQYPKVSHSFIRREILELENQGAEVLRIALRGWEQRVVDEQDIAEQGRTRYVLKGGVLQLPLCTLLLLVKGPLRFVRTFGESLSLSRGSDKALIKHLICFLEACVAARWASTAGATHIHAHFGTNSAEVALLASLLSGIPYSFTVHGPDEFDHPEGLRLRKKIHHASCVMAVSSYGRSQLYRWADTKDWDKIVVVHCGLDMASFDVPEIANGQGSHTLVCVGRLSEQKGQLLLLEALRQVLDSGVSCQIVLAGDGEMREAIERRAKTLGVLDHLEITGWIDSAQVKRQILAARALVLPSFAEGLPVVLMEALALRRPVITTYVAGIPELVQDGVNGWLVPAGDVRGLAQAMIACLECSEDKLATMGTNGRTRAMSRHDIRTQATELLNLFRKSFG